jgi:uracil-DNA glycosylase family protein
MAHYEGAERFIPHTLQVAALAEAAQRCEGCDLYARASQTVFGAGRRTARLMMVGEQPGDVEDQRGTPFVGPAGHVLDRALAEAGIERSAIYLTNAVKHFRWKSAERGNRRIHDKPAASHVTACQPWLAAELHAIRPRLIVALGATAASSLFGTTFRLSEHRSEKLAWPPAAGAFAGDPTPIGAAYATIHPSAVLRASKQDRETIYRGLLEDLTLVAEQLAG